MPGTGGLRGIGIHDKLICAQHGNPHNPLAHICTMGSLCHKPGQLPDA